MNGDLHAVEAEHGAVFSRLNDGQLPARFAGVAEEWAAVRQRCGLFDAGFRTVLRATGEDRVTFLQGMLTNDVAKLSPGTGTYAALLTIQGRVVTDLRVFALADELWLDVPTTHVGALRDSLERYIIADDVELLATDQVAPLVIVEGPTAARVLVGVIGESTMDLAPFAHREMVFDGVKVRVAAVTHSGEPGYVLFGPSSLAARLWAHCHAAGAEPVGMEALDVLRIEAGIPWVGREMDESTLVGEVGLEAAISFSKGCYLGQEVVERVAARGQVQRKLVGLLCAGNVAPPRDAKVMIDGKELGRVTSGTWSPARQQGVALAVARREAWEAGTQVTVDWQVDNCSAAVSALPFLTR